MEDMDRYGDYNEIDDEPARRGVLGIVIKVLIGLVCAAVIGVIAFRITIFNNYPKEVGDILWTDALAERYEAEGDGLGVFTQTTRLNYDDPKEGNFFFGELVVVPDADHLQLTVRYNASLAEAIKAEYGVELDMDADPLELFDFKLVRTASGYVPPEDGSAEQIPTEQVGVISASKSHSEMMYRYIRLAFDGVDFGLGEGETPVGWYRLEITVKGVDMQPYTLPVYQAALELEDRPIARREVPGDDQ